jgi:hypothetical protein
MQTNDNPLMSRKAALDYLAQTYGYRRAPITAATWASQGTGPPLQKIGRYVFHRKNDLDAWMESRLNAGQRSIKKAPQLVAGRTL